MSPTPGSRAASPGIGAFTRLFGIYINDQAAIGTSLSYNLLSASAASFVTPSSTLGGNLFQGRVALGNYADVGQWTLNPGDPATNLSAELLLEPLANGVPEGQGAVKVPIHTKVGYARKLYGRDEAVRAALLDTLHAAKPPAVLFTASHGMAIRSGRPNQVTDNGGLLCQDWSGFGGVRREHYLAAADVPDDANVSGLVAFFFACFGTSSAAATAPN